MSRVPKVRLRVPDAGGLHRREVISQIFKADLLAEPKLVNTFMGLCGQGGHKPLECVGQQDESLLALYLASKRRTATPLHPDLAAIFPGVAQVAELQNRILNAYGNGNGLPSDWQDQLHRMGVMVSGELTLPRNRIRAQKTPVL